MMKSEERIAHDFLAARFRTEPIYEPLGKDKPPDFSIAHVAFEVRRLNQRYLHQDGTNEALETVDYPLSGAVRGELDKIPFSEEKGSFFWMLSFSRPIKERPGTIAKKLVGAAKRHYSHGARERLVADADQVTLELIPARVPYGKAFLSAMQSDYDAGGFLGDIYPTSIRLALEEKISKTKSVARNFERWVLLLVDAIGVASRDEIGSLSLDLQHFSSIAIINLDGSFAFDFPANSLDGGFLPRRN